MPGDQVYSYGLNSYGLCSYGLYSYGLYSYGLKTNRLHRDARRLLVVVIRVVERLEQPEQSFDHTVDGLHARARARARARMSGVHSGKLCA